MNILDKYRSIVVDINDSILSALKTMELERCKLLIVSKNGRYRSLISIGDIQRAIIANVNLSESIFKILREKVNVSTIHDDVAEITKYMLASQAECMPILNDDGDLVEVLFWEDVFEKKEKRNSVINENLPVIIMAGGKGSRLAPLTNVLPKPLVPIGEKTIIEDIMDRFVYVGCNNFYISVNYKAEMMKYYLTELNNPNYNISYFQERKPMGTAGSLSLLKGKINQTFFVSNCDIIIDEDYNEIYKYHKENNNEITLVAALKYIKIPYGTVDTREDGLLCSMDEKPEFTFKINAGLYILEPHLIDEIPCEAQLFHITELINNLKEQNRRVGVFPVSQSSWIDMGTWEEYMRFIK